PPSGTRSPATRRAAPSTATGARAGPATGTTASGCGSTWARPGGSGGSRSTGSAPTPVPTASTCPRTAPPGAPSGPPPPATAAWTRPGSPPCRPGTCGCRGWSGEPSGATPCTRSACTAGEPAGGPATSGRDPRGGRDGPAPRSAPLRQRTVQQLPHRVQGRLPVGGHEPDAGPAVPYVGLVEGPLVPQRPQHLGAGDGVGRQHALPQPGVPRAQCVDRRCLRAVPLHQPAGRGQGGQGAGRGGAHQREGGRAGRAGRQPAHAHRGVDGVLGHPPVGGELAAHDGDHALGRGEDRVPP